MIEKLRVKADPGQEENIELPADKYRAEVSKSFGDNYCPGSVAQCDLRFKQDMLLKTLSTE